MTRPDLRILAADTLCALIFLSAAVSTAGLFVPSNPDTAWLFAWGYIVWKATVVTAGSLFCGLWILMRVGIIR